jgi:hypothetical protein
MDITIAAPIPSCSSTRPAAAFAARFTGCASPVLRPIAIDTPTICKNSKNAAARCVSWT